MSVIAHLKPFPAESVSVSGNAVGTDDIRTLAEWVWIRKTRSAAFDLYYDDGVSNEAVVIPTKYISMGENLVPTPPYSSQKDILNYRTTAVSANGDSGPPNYTPVWSYVLSLGETMFYNPVRVDGELVTSGGFFEYGVRLILDVATDANSGVLSTNPAAGRSSAATCVFEGVPMALYEDLGDPDIPGFSGTITITGIDDW